MNIGIDAHAAEREGHGNGTYIRNVIRELVRLESPHSFSLYAVDAGHAFYKELPDDPRFRIRAVGARNPLVRIPFALARAARRDALDVLHVQYIAPPVHRGRLVATIHDLGFLSVPRTFSRAFVLRSRLLVRRTARRADTIITGSAYARDHIARAYGLNPAKIEVVHYGVEESYRRRLSEGEIGRALDTYGVHRPYVLSVGRLNPRKNLAALVRAFSGLKSRRRLPHTLVIAGKEDFGAAALLKEIRGAGASDVVFTGFVADADLPALYQGADIFLYPSLFEGVGLPVLEAMASGVPVVTSDRSSLPEIAGGAALIVDPTDERRISDAMEKLLDDRGSREECVRRGLARSAEFRWDETARRILRVYEGL
ncbi:MAG TPA: glycosyltransferase family 1 protein [Acidobacteriota bacterium]|nr:glycosyltransferase family 1 protein [Acidobacteriota bacterium]